MTKTNVRKSSVLRTALSVHNKNSNNTNNKNIVIAVIYYYATHKIDRLPRGICIIILSYIDILLSSESPRVARSNLDFFFAR